MKYIKRFNQLFEALEAVLLKPKYKNPEYEFKEFFRVFKSSIELRLLIPPTVDQKIFEIKGEGFDGEPKWLENHVDPPSKPEEINTVELLEIAEKEDPRFVPFILWCQELFENGKMEKIPLGFMTKNLTTKFKNHDWDSLQKDPNFLQNCEIEYNKALEAGLNDDILSKETGLVKKYPKITIWMAQFWSPYIKGSIEYFNKTVNSGGKLPCTQFILHEGVYYTVGGRRRMFWHFYNEFDPTVWVIAA